MWSFKCFASLRSWRRRVFIFRTVQPYRFLWPHRVSHNPAKHSELLTHSRNSQKEKTQIKRGGKRCTNTDGGVWERRIYLSAQLDSIEGFPRLHSSALLVVAFKSGGKLRDQVPAGEAVTQIQWRSTSRGDGWRSEFGARLTEAKMSCLL